MARAAFEDEVGQLIARGPETLDLRFCAPRRPYTARSRITPASTRARHDDLFLARIRIRMKLVFRETLPSDIEGLIAIRERTRENAISKRQLASLGITAESIAGSMASGRVKGWVCLHNSKLVAFCNGD